MLERVEFRIERGTPTDAEIAALVTVFLARRPAPAPPAPKRSRWAQSALPGYRRPWA
jgi:hypothetical protein